jgi:hypothetical protein
MSDELETFKKKYRATVSEGRKRYSVPKKIRYDQIQDLDMNFDVEYGVQIDMSQRDFRQLIGMEAYFESQLNNRDWTWEGGYAKSIVDVHEKELRIRNSNPAAAKAYEKYQTLLRMVDSYYD